MMTDISIFLSFNVELSKLITFIFCKIPLMNQEENNTLIKIFK